MTQLSEEQQERLGKLRERCQQAITAAIDKYEFRPLPRWGDIDFLLSLLDTQAQSSLSQLMTDEDECIAREQAALEAGEKRMRDKCVEKVREHARFFNSKGFARTASALFKAADDVELLTLDKNP